MKYKTAKNPQWANIEKTHLQCFVNFEKFNDEFVSFVAVEFGDYEHTHEIFARAVAGEFGPVADYVPPPPPPEPVKTVQEKTTVENTAESAEGGSASATT